MIIVFGGLNMDIIFNVPTLPAPGDQTLVDSYLTMPGGKGANQAYAAAQSGAIVKMYGCVGNDGFGKELIKNLKKAGVGVLTIRKTNAAPTGTAAIFIDPNAENCIIGAASANNELRADQLPDKVLKKAKYALLQREIREQETIKVIERAHALGVKVVLNLAPAGKIAPDVLQKVDYLIVNEAEARALNADQDLMGKGLAKYLAETYAMTVVLTLGSKGLVASDPKGQIIEIPAMPIQAIDTVGAGDAFVGCFVACLDKGLSLEDALRHGTAAGAITCQRHGAQVAPTWAEIKKVLKA